MRDQGTALGRGRLAAALSASVALGVLQLWMLGAERAHLFAPGFVFNGGALLSWWAVCELLARVRLPQRAVSSLYYPVLMLQCGLVFAHTYVFDVAIERRLTWLDMTLAGTRYFFEIILPARGYVALLALYAAIALGALALTRPVLRVPPRELWVGVLLVLGSTQFVHAAPRVASPLYDSTRELWELATLPKVYVAPRVPTRGELAVLDKSERTRPPTETRFSKIIVLVMETMTAQLFERESRALPESAFVHRERARTHRFERYYPNNQDSRTGMLDMLFSRLVPFEAYSDEGVAGYAHLATQPSLLERLRERSFKSAFAVSQTTLEEVVGDMPWDATLRLDEVQIQEAQQAHKLCFTPDEYERSCEDLALLPSVVDFVATHERAFVYQEFIWGHAYEYNEASGKTNTAYYSEYVDALLTALEARGLRDETLIALTSDHGFRDRGRQHEPEVYRVPLLLHAAQFTQRSDPRLLSHSDLGMLLFEQLGADAPRVAENPFVMIVGPTGQGHLFVVGQRGGHMLLRHKAGLDLLVARAGFEEHSPGELLSLFRHYRALFAAPPR